MPTVRNGPAATRAGLGCPPHRFGRAT